MKIEVRTISPLAHGEYSDGIDIGNFTNFRRLPMLHNGKLYQIPVLSGNSIRGILRRFLAREIVDKFEMKEALGKSFDRFYVAVANGGNLDKTMDVAVDTNRLREIRSIFPLLSVLGASLYRYMLPGMVNIGFAIPRCREMETGDVPLYELTADIGLVRHLDRTVANVDDAKPMPYTIEAVAPGAVFDVNIGFAPQATELERACINHGLKHLRYLGGKNGAGFGEVSIAGYGDDALYCQWLENPETKDKLKQFAEDL